MPKHWRVRLVGGPLDGGWHESMAAMMPHKMGLDFDGYLFWYVIDPDTMTATFDEDTEPEQIQKGGDDD